MTDQEYLGMIEKLEYILDRKFHGTTAEEKAIYYYFYDYLWLNEDLRLGRYNFHADFISKFLKSLKPYQGKLYRGGYFLLEDLEDNYKIGSEVIWHGFTSASLSEDVAKSFANKADKAGNNFVKTLFLFDSKNAKPVFNLHPLIIGDAKECIFDRDSKFLISDRTSENGLLEIYMKEV
ncbi:hypothetical protein H6G54_05200 [Anabaena cylindrica FACHB-243]|uniref:NAD(+)--protein-arginine ADP-ribosyltransferase n=1 Tax=Anabaena cylindrica (strain ATCC 27899 / PCC 7122) TaxID=272123 RepID=K9ZNP5_ANACC|nr:MULTISPECIES: hypothetical protein [Anabaena]AFZ60816.1 hypothetical protein Anacy_5504 [Anabaena cylindrica PCC 7122]MBD2417116.1 hypothetical protein [Anabaena cylindrica FACHB-243]MBY5280812.1 hypothetical protein [Anabaena sp. CCAP 1446/1C]MBY5307088.1 hypothetical protein [Anabaena sp. CCAP 1446/1C]MCM2406817.1 hypothetical protein [Anabaena sp. CCAP 1446/1C]